MAVNDSAEVVPCILAEVSLGLIRNLTSLLENLWKIIQLYSRKPGSGCPG